MRALSEAIRSVPVEQSDDVFRTMIMARLQSEQLPQDFVLGVDAALWYGNAQAKGLAIEQVALNGISGQMLPIIDAALAHPELTETAVRTLARIRNERARFFLDELLRGSDPAVRGLAAEALAAIGGEALSMLRDGMSDPDVEVREASVRAVLQVASVADLSTLHHYYGTFTDDDAELRELVRERALLLERLLEAHETGADAIPTPQ